MLKLISLLLFVSLLLASGVAIAVAGQEKVTLCHKPGTPAEGTLEVAEAAVQAHLDHGDVLGVCAPPVLDAYTALNDSLLDGLYYEAMFENLEFNGGEVVTISCDVPWELEIRYPGGGIELSRFQCLCTPQGCVCESFQQTFNSGIHGLWWFAEVEANWVVTCE